MEEKTNPALALRLEEILKQQKAEISPEIMKKAKNVSKRLTTVVLELASAAIENSIRFDSRPLQIFETFVSQLENAAQQGENTYLPQVQPEKEPDLNQSLRTYVLAQPQGNRLTFEAVKLYLDAIAERDVPPQEVGRRLKKLEEEGLLQKDQTHKGKRTIYIIKEPSKTYPIPQQEPAVETPQGVSYNSQENKVYFNDKPLRLRQRGTSLIARLSQSPNQPVEFLPLAEHVFNRDFSKDERTAKRSLIYVVATARHSIENAGAQDPKRYIVTTDVGYALYPQGKPQEPTSAGTAKKPRSRFKPGENKDIINRWSDGIPPDTKLLSTIAYKQAAPLFGDKGPPSSQAFGNVLINFVDGWERITEGRLLYYHKLPSSSS